MKTIWRNTLLCFVLAALLFAQCPMTAFAAETYPEIWYLQGGVPDESGAWTPEYWVDANGNRMQETPKTSVKRARAAADLPRSYDLRDYGLVTSVKTQAGAESCWVFGPIASLESSYIRQGFGTTENTDFSEAHLVWFGQHQRTPDTSDPTYGDGMEVARPFAKGGNWTTASSQLLRGSGLQLEQNAPWITSYDQDELMQMAQPESDRYVSYARMWSAQKVVDNSPATLKQLIMQNGAATLSYYDDYSEYQKGQISVSGYSTDKRCYYQTARTGTTNHTVTVVGWDDDFSNANFNPEQQPTGNGAWLIKGSWGSTWGDGGYYWISYEDPSLGQFVSFVAAPVDTYDHIYQYDGTSPKTRLALSNSIRMANVFTAERNEMLTHAAFFSPNEITVKATVEVYVAPEGFQYSGTHPTNGMQKISDATTTISSVEYGYTTVELNTPVRLTEGGKFTVSVTFEKSGVSVQVPVEGYAVNNPGDGVVTCAGNVGDSFFGYGSYWYDTNAYAHTSGTLDLNSVPVKAMTCDLETAEPTLALQSAPDKTAYYIGESLDTAGLSLLYTDEYGNAQTVTEGFACDPAVFTALGTQTVTVTYQGLSVTFDVTVEPYVPTLALQSAPDKTTYYIGESLDTADLSLLYTDEYGNAQTVTEGFACDPVVFTALGTQTVTVTYEGLSVTFDVTVEPYVPTLTLQSAPDKTTYYIGESLDTTGLSLLYIDEYGDAQTVTEGFTCDPAVFNVFGTQIVTVTYEGLSVTFDVTVEPYVPTLTLQSAPDKTTYYIGESLDTVGLSLLYTDEYGDALVVTEGFACDPVVFSAFGTQTVTVTYEGLSVTFDVTVEAYVPTLALQSAPDKTTYYIGESLDTTGLSLLYIDEYGDAQTVTEGFTCDPAVFNVFGTQIVTVTYEGLSVTFDVTVEPYVPTLTLQSAPDKTTYYIGESLDTTGLSLLYTDEYGNALVVTEGFTCDPVVFSALGTQIVTVTHEGLSVTFDVTVEAEGLLLVSDATARAGETVDVAVRIGDNPGIVSAWLELDYDTNTLELVDVRNGDIFADGFFTPGGDLTVTPFRVLFIDALSQTNYTQDGDLVIFTFRVRTQAPAGETEIRVNYKKSSTCDVTLQSVSFRTQDGTFTVERLPGDVNADGVVGMMDIVLLRRFLAGWDVTINLSNADVDLQEGVDLRDVAYITRFLAGGYGLTLH